MKIIATDNQNRDGVDDLLVAENVDDRWAIIIADALNKSLCTSNQSSKFFRAVEDDHKLYKFEP